MKTKLFLVVLAGMLLAGCGRDNNSYTTVQADAAASAPSSSVQSLVDQENAYRLSLGQTLLSPGLSCSVQAVASGQWLSSSSPGYNSGQGVVVLTGTTYTFLNNTGFDQENQVSGQPNNILPTSIQPLFLGNYRISCSGFLVVEQDGYQGFDLSSDDGSILTVDGTQIINNDGNHGITTKSGTKSIRRGVKSFSLVYAQTGYGNFALVLNQNGNLLPAANLFH